MIIHYLKLARRVLARNKYYTAINVFGLTCGMLSALIIAKYVGGSSQFDSFHVKKDRIYSLTQQESINGNAQPRTNATYWGAGELIQQFPEVVYTTRYNYHVESLVIAEDKKGNRASFTEKKIFVTDSLFFKVFTFSMIQGNPQTALSTPQSVILTSSASRKYFGDADPLGNVLSIRVPWGAENIYTVTGVIADIPKRSEFTFDLLVTQDPMTGNDVWLSPDYSTYVLLKENANTAELTKKLTRQLNNLEQLKSTHKVVTLSLHSLADVKLSTTEYLLAAIGILIVIICWVNYINQVIAQSYGRIKEIGVLRVMGATKTNLQIQFITESCLICLTSFIFVTGTYAIIEPSLQSFTNGHLLPLIGDPTSINFLFLAIFAIGIILAAVIPAMIIFSQDFATAVRNAYRSKIGSLGLRKGLVVLQFTISSVLVISIFVIRDQLAFMKKKDKGFDPQNILVIKAPIVKGTRYVRTEALELLKDRCRELPNVSDVTSSTTVPGEEYRYETYVSFEDRNEKTLVHQSLVDEHFFDLYKVDFIAGRNFLPDAKSKNRSSIILNESAARGLGIADLNSAINAKVRDHESDIEYDVIGIVKDFHQTSLKYMVRPMAFRFDVSRGHLSLGIRNAGPNDFDVGAIKKTWELVYPDASFEYFFLENKFDAQDASDRNFGDLFEYFTILSIILSCLGLFALSHLISTKRQREIGIRKVFGASSAKIVAIFLRGYLGPLGISVLVGVPAAYLLMTLWLRNYAYRVEIGIELIAMAIVSLVLLFLLTVTYHTIRSSVTNPAAILKD
jgi:putative ABC transport system permease protein